VLEHYPIECDSKANRRKITSLIAPTDMLHPICETSFLHRSEFLFRIIHPPLSNIHLNMPV